MFRKNVRYMRSYTAASLLWCGLIFHERPMLNQSGAAIQVEEAGIRAFTSLPPSARLFEMARDLVTVSVPASSGIIVKYREEFTV